jgi:catecholate siderophore receptor
MNHKLRTLPYFVAACFAAPLHGAFAQTTLPEVTVTAQAAQETGYEAVDSAAATKINAALRDVPQAVNVVPLAVLRDQNALSLQDALQNVPGLGYSVGDGQRDQVAIRGFTAIGDQFVDGVRDDAMYFRDLSNIERVEVLKGPASVLYGRGSAGGLVNRVTRKPQEQPLRQLGATVGSEGQLRTDFDLGAASTGKDVLMRITGALEDSKGFRNQSFLQRQAVAPSATFRLGRATSLTLQADYLRDKRLADQGVPSYNGRPVDVPVETYYGAANGKERAFVESKVASGTATLDHAFNADLKLHSVLRSYDFQLDRNYTGIGTISAGAKPTVSIGQTHRTRDEDGYYLQNELSQRLALGGIQHQLLYGLEIGRQHKAELLRSKNNVATYDLFNPVLTVLPAIPDSVVPGADNKNRFDIAAGYLQDLASIGAHWKVLAGLRYDRLKQQRDDRTAKNIDLERTDHTVSPRLGAVYQPDSQLSLYAGYSKSFQPIADSFVFRINSDDLKPTVTASKEVGAKVDLGGKASLTASLFDMSQTNIQVADPANTGFALPVGKQRTRGMELTLAGELARDWEVLAGYAFLHGRIEESTERTSAGTPFKGNTPSLTPRHAANLWIKHKLGERFYVAAGGQAVAARYASPDDLTTLPGYGVLNLGAGYSGEQLDVTLTLKNLLDRRYFVSAHSGANDYNMPGDPRTLVASVRYRF